MSKHILVIDDEPEFRNTMKEILSLDGYQVDIPHHLASAVASALQGIHDLIILDLRMPGLDGLEIARLFRDQGLERPSWSFPAISPIPFPPNCIKSVSSISCPNPPGFHSFSMPSKKPSLRRLSLQN